MGDQTGSVSLRARGDQIELLQNLSSTNGAVVLRNCSAELYQGKHLRLLVSKWGKMSAYPDQIKSTPSPPGKLNLDRNFTRVDLSRVATNMSFTGAGGAIQSGAAPHRASGYHHHRGGNRATTQPSKAMPYIHYGSQPYTHQQLFQQGSPHGFGDHYIDSPLQPQLFQYTAQQPHHNQHQL